MYEFGSACWYDEYFGHTRLVNAPEDLLKVKALILWGGEDISPKIYGESPKYTNASALPSERDALEILLVQEAVRLGKPILGICRGAQLLCALHGGKLWQHVTNHAGRYHFIELKTGQKIETNSLHHQMMRPDKDAEILAQTPVALARKKYSENEVAIDDTTPDPEIVWFPKFRALGVQGHPEYLPLKHELVRLTQQLFEEKTNAVYAWRRS